MEAIKTLRVIARTLALCLMTIALYPVWLAGKLLFKPFKRGGRRWRNVIFRAWGRGAAKILGLRIEVRGEPPQPPFFLVSNHLGYIDAVTFAACLDCVFIAKSEL